MRRTAFGNRKPRPTTILAVGIAIGLVGNIATGTVQVEAPWWPWLVWSAVGLLVITALRLERTARRRLDLTAAAALAATVTRQWRHEAKVRGLDDPNPIPVRWRGTTDGGGPAVTGSSAHPDEMAALFRSLPRRRLVLLGGPGSGKTTLAVLLVRELVETRGEGDPVPVLLPVGGWDVRKHQHLRDWLAARLKEDYRDLDEKAVRDLVADSMVLPVLDGLDELPAETRAEVLKAINDSLTRSDQIILTSRVEEFAESVSTAGAIGSATVVEPEPLDRAAAADYLESSLEPADRGAWRTVLTVLRTGPDTHPLVDLCSTPLGLWLVRTVHAVPRGDPSPLLDEEDAATLRGRLLDRLVPVVADRRPSAEPAPSPFSPRGRYQADDVTRWLTHLARDLDHPEAPGRDVEWWRLSRGLKPLHTAVYVVGAAVFAWMFWRIGAVLESGRVPAVVLGAICGVCVVLLFDSVGGLEADMGTAWTPRFAIAELILVVKIMGMNMVGLAGCTLALTVVMGVPGTLWTLLTTGGLDLAVDGDSVRTGALVAVAALAIAYTFFAEDDMFGVAKSGTPEADWRLSRRLSRHRTAAGAVAGGLLVGLWAAQFRGSTDVLVLGGMAAATSALAVRSGTLSAKSWTSYVAVALRLGLRRELPLRPMRFLADMHRLGLLRAVGPVYQFCHAELQDRLARNGEGARPA